VIETVREITEHPIPTIDCPRREGDPARLIADSALAREILGWSPAYDDLRTIVAHAWQWEKKLARSR
jgi:UDP-glucose 4-epimerase